MSWMRSRDGVAGLAGMPLATNASVAKSAAPQKNDAQIAYEMRKLAYTHGPHIARQICKSDKAMMDSSLADTDNLVGDSDVTRISLPTSSEHGPSTCQTSLWKMH